MKARYAVLFQRRRERCNADAKPPDVARAEVVQNYAKSLAKPLTEIVTQ
jgi:hypothetical protein